jgi:CNT family concentrative nucleoside transporter
MGFLQGIFGIVSLLSLAFLFSENRRAVPVRVVVAGLLLQSVLAILLIKLPPVAAVVSLVARGVGVIEKATEAGTSFVFGYLGGAPLPFEPTKDGTSLILAFHVFPLILVICALASLLFHWGIMQRIVGVFAYVLRRTVGIGGALGIGAAVHVFVGMVEAPLLIRPYLAGMARGELFALMSCGMAGIAGTVMVIYGRILGPVIPDAFSNVLTAAIISTPAAIAVAAIMVPFAPRPDEDAKIVIEDPPLNAMEAIARGTSDGIVILANVIAYLIVLLAMVALVNSALGVLPDVDGAPVTLQRLFALIFYPVMWLIGIAPADLPTAARLMSTKTVLNEFIAYFDLAALPPGSLSARSQLILTYALCGFANFGSVGIMVGGLCAMSPDRKHDIVGLGLKTLVSGTIATCMSGAVIGILT